MNYDELLKRLDKRRQREWNGALQDWGWAYDPECKEAASAIRSLQAKLDAIQPRPIEEAPRDGTWILLGDPAPDWVTVQWDDIESLWVDADGDYHSGDRFLDLKALLDVGIRNLKPEVGNG